MVFNGEIKNLVSLLTNNDWQTGNVTPSKINDEPY